MPKVRIVRTYEVTLNQEAIDWASEHGVYQGMIEAAAECADGGDHEGFLIYGHAPLSPPEDEWWAWVADENDFPPDYERLYGPTPYVAEEVHRAV